MAVRDIKEYYFERVQEYINLKEDLKDFEQAFKNGYITEDRIEEIKTEISRLEENKARIEYIMFLLELPNRKSKQDKFKKQNKKVLNHLTEQKADSESIRMENQSIVAKIKADLDKITKE